jgi:hypothetical protein
MGFLGDAESSLFGVLQSDGETGSLQVRGFHRAGNRVLGISDFLSLSLPSPPAGRPKAQSEIPTMGKPSIRANLTRFSFRSGI